MLPLGEIQDLICLVSYNCLGIYNDLNKISNLKRELKDIHAHSSSAPLNSHVLMQHQKVSKGLVALRETRVHILASCVRSGKVHNLSELQFPHVTNGRTGLAYKCGWNDDMSQGKCPARGRCSVNSRDPCFSSPSCAGYRTPPKFPATNFSMRRPQPLFIPWHLPGKL